jgi:hypothetical protein
LDLRYELARWGGEYPLLRLGVLRLWLIDRNTGRQPPFGEPAGMDYIDEELSVLLPAWLTEHREAALHGDTGYLPAADVSGCEINSPVPLPDNSTGKTIPRSMRMSTRGSWITLASPNSPTAGSHG